jgi:hypothetical protein
MNPAGFCNPQIVSQLARGDKTTVVAPQLDGGMFWFMWKRFSGS